SPATATSGNQWAAIGMLVAVIATLFDHHIVSYPIIIAGMVVGTVIGAVGALKVKITAMPQMVALFNGTGGGAAALVAASEYLQSTEGGQFPGTVFVGTTLITGLIGSISFSGSAIAFGKLQELLSGRPLTYPLQQWVNSAIALGALGAMGALMAGSQPLWLFPVFFVLALTLGVSVVLPIGGGDMPVIIAVLNSMTGMAAATSGFILSNNALIISGALVGASGSILTILMSRAMNRSLFNVMFGAFGAVVQTARPADAAMVKGAVKDYTVEDAITVLENARSLIIVPGYGLAVSHGQHAIRELADLLSDKGAEVRYAIHPVAGRMPGHMNVLLAEADVPYDQLFDMDAINDDFQKTDVALVIGANDVVNPAAKDTPSSPIYGMPILNVEQAKTVIVMKRSMNPGFAGIENELFYKENTMMIFGDAKKTLSHMITCLKD
ncbi:MAG: NAD(P)(+) transhydrogenase (Re/Si-specific) subunit beta, partial [Nitrospirae bacterium]|nr:NAD(P)(+) transhydrogenase (Re/Si-specific) subunit beta [Nitrospirota bacterium]